MASLQLAAAVLALGCVALPLGAGAQTLEANSASFNSGYGRIAGQENHVVTYASRDSSNNRVIVDGVMLTGSDQSVYSRADTGGAFDSYSGVGSFGGSASAIGNSLTVVTQGNYNTVIVDSTQINTGAVTAQTNATGAH